MSTNMRVVVMAQTNTEVRAERIKELRKSITIVGRLMGRYPNESETWELLNKAREKLFLAIGAMDTHQDL